MSDRLFFPLLMLVALLMIALALSWPRGVEAPLSTRSGRPAVKTGPAIADPDQPGPRAVGP